VSFEPTVSDSTGGIDKPSGLVVASPKKAIVVSRAKPKSILRPSKRIVQETDSIASRIKERRQHPVIVPVSTAPEPQSIAERVAERRRMQQPVQLEIAMPVLDQETGKLLEYRQLLVHPRYKDVWNRSAADEFGRLAQGIKGRVKATDTIRFIA
jgi:hypothetical protein